MVSATRISDPPPICSIRSNNPLTVARILFLTQVLPYPLDAGPKVRAYYMLRHLAATHEVTLVTFVRPDDKPEYIEHLRQIAQRMSCEMPGRLTTSEVNSRILAGGFCIYL